MLHHGSTWTELIFITNTLLLHDHLHDTNQGSMYINVRTALVLPYAPDYSLPRFQIHKGVNV